MEITFNHQDMQKLRDCTVSLEDCLGTLDDKWMQLQWDVTYTHSIAFKHVPRLDDLENRLRRNNVRALGVIENVADKNSVTFIEQWLLNNLGKD